MRDDAEGVSEPIVSIGLGGRFSRMTLCMFIAAELGLSVFHAHTAGVIVGFAAMTLIQLDWRRSSPETRASEPVMRVRWGQAAAGGVVVGMLAVTAFLFVSEAASLGVLLVVVLGWSGYAEFARRDAATGARA
jgi:hypothetical protein